LFVVQNLNRLSAPRAETVLRAAARSWPELHRDALGWFASVIVQWDDLDRRFVAAGISTEPGSRS